jgi:hypothetical protein
MRTKSTTEAPACASVIDSQLILELSDLAYKIQFSAEEAGYMAEMSLDRIADNGLCNSKSDDPNIYFPLRERQILRFICDDVGDRISALHDLASNLVSSLNALHDEMRARG